jgi:hypothetical protein
MKTNFSPEDGKSVSPGESPGVGEAGSPGQVKMLQMLFDVVNYVYKELLFVSGADAADQQIIDAVYSELAKIVYFCRSNGMVAKKGEEVTHG